MAIDLPETGAAKNHVETPRYSFREASRILQLPPAAATLLVPNYVKAYRGVAAKSHHGLDPRTASLTDIRLGLRSIASRWFWGPQSPALLSFRDLAAGFVLAEAADSVVERLYSDEPQGPPEDLATVFDLLASPEWRMELFGAEPRRLADRLLVPLAAWLGAEESNEAAWARFAARLERVEKREGQPRRIQFADPTACRLFLAVSIDPERRFGWPIVLPTATPTQILHDRFLAGDSISELADDYGLEATIVEEAVRYEAGCDAAAGGRFTEVEE